MLPPRSLASCQCSYFPILRQDLRSYSSILPPAVSVAASWHLHCTRKQGLDDSSQSYRFCHEEISDLSSHSPLGLKESRDMKNFDCRGSFHGLQCHCCESEGPRSSSSVEPHSQVKQISKDTKFHNEDTWNGLLVNLKVIR